MTVLLGVVLKCLFELNLPVFRDGGKRGWGEGASCPGHCILPFRERKAIIDNSFISNDCSLGNSVKSDSILFCLNSVCKIFSFFFFFFLFF